MNFDDICVGFTWLPPENDLPELNLLLETKIPETSKLRGPIDKLKTFLSKLFNRTLSVSEFKSRTDFSNSEDQYKTPIYFFYKEYLFDVYCKIQTEKNCTLVDEFKKLLYIFCCRNHSNSPHLWMKIDITIFTENDLKTSDYFIDLNNFALGNLVKLNTFVEHFSSESSLNSYDYKITQVKVKFLHDEQVLHVYFVVGNAKFSLKKRGSHSHRMHKLVIPYSSLHTILISKGKNLTVYFRLYTTPLLFAVDQDEDAENYISYMDLTYNTDWFRVITLFDDCPSNISKEFSMNSVLRLNFSKDCYEVMKIVHHHKSVQIYFTSMTIVPFVKVQPVMQIQDFDCYFGFQCLLTHSYEILDQLMVQEDRETFKIFVMQKCSENPKALSMAFYIIHYALTQSNIILLNYSLKILYKKLVQDISHFIHFNIIQNNSATHNLLLIKRAVIIPTHVRFLPPQPILKSRALRSCDYNFSLRLSIRDVNLETINFSFKGFSEDKKKLLKNFFNIYYKKVLLKGIKIGRRCYQYVGSSTSQLRGHGLWFYAKDESGKTAKILREEFGNMDKIKQVPKYMARMGQTFSQAMGNIIVPQKDTNIERPEEDVKGGIKQYLHDEDLDYPKKFLIPINNEKEQIVYDEPYIFSDGIGRISLEIAEEVYKELGVEEERPSAMQIRYAGCKGMLVVDPNLQGRKILFRESMKKFSSSNDSLEILKFSEKRTASLNRPFITILEQLGVVKEVFIKMQKEMIQNHIKSMFHESEACDFLNRNSQLRFDFIKMYEVDIHFTEDPLFRSMIYALFRKQLEMLRTKVNIEIPVNKGRAMFGVLDETFTLEYGQVFVQYSDWNTDEPVILKETIVVTKNPCMHPGDVRKFEAVDVEGLHHIRDCIVFPAKGPRPHPDEMAGSDLDGDEYHVIWFKDLIFKRENFEAMHYAMRKDHSKDLERPIEPADELDHLSDYIINDNVGLIANAHLFIADKLKEGIFSENCIRLAAKYAIALDFAKSGKVATRNRKDRVFNYPDFAEKFEKNTYLSRKALGVLYRNCKRLEMGLETSNSEIEYKLDQDLICKNWRKYKESASELYKRYSQKVEYLMNIYSFENEGELLAGSIINPPKYYEQRHDLDNLKALLEYEIRWIFQDLEKQFFKEFGGKPKDKCYTLEMFQKASAWYAVAYDQMTEKSHRCYGFPWSVSGVLIELKRIKHKQNNTRRFNYKSLLEKIVDECLMTYMPNITENSDISEIYENRLGVLDEAYKVLMKWLETQRDQFLISDLREFENCINREFEAVSEVLTTCNIQYIQKLKENNNIKKAISPCYYVIETMLRIASIKTNVRFSINDTAQELGLLSWVTLIKLACTYNPQYLGIPNKEGNCAQSIFYMPQDNVISTFKLFLFENNNDSQEFSLKLLKEPDEVIRYFCELTKLKKIDFRYDIDRGKEYYARFTIMGTRYSIEKLKELIVLDEFFKWVVEGRDVFSTH